MSSTETPVPAAARPQPAWTLWAILAALPWLLPTHTDPWPTFYPEALTAFALAAAAFALAWRQGDPWPAGALAFAALALAAVPALQAADGRFTYPREAALVALNLAGLGAALLLGRRATPALLDALFGSFALAALVSTGLALYQWLGMDTLGPLVAAAVRGGRPGANVGQPNNLSTLLVWGIVGLWWAQRRGRLGAPVALAGAAFLLLGVALTQSRTGWLAVALLAVVAAIGRRTLLPGRGTSALVALAAWFVVVVLALQPVSHALLREAPLSLERQAETGKRPIIWRLGLAAVAERPWAGWGWNQSVRAHVELAPRFEGLNVPVGHAHNAVLDLLVWNGVPVGLAVAAGLALWFWRRLHEARQAQQQLLLLALAALGLHALLELPHVYAFFFLPAGVLMGALEARSAHARAWALPRAAVLAWLALPTALLALAWHEYGLVEDDVASYRLREANIGIRPPPPPPQVLLLQPLMQALLDLRTVPRRAMPAPERQRLHAASLRHPTVGAQFRDAEAAALNGDPEGAAWSLGRLCLMHSADECRAAGRDWQALGAAGKPELDPALLPSAAAPPQSPLRRRKHGADDRTPAPGTRHRRRRRPLAAGLQRVAFAHVPESGAGGRAVGLVRGRERAVLGRRRPRAAGAAGGAGADAGLDLLVLGTGLAAHRAGPLGAGAGAGGRRAGRRRRRGSRAR